MSRLLRQVSFGAVLAALVLGAIVGASAQVFPVRWADDPEPTAPAVNAGAVAIGGGGISLNPDQTTERGAANSNFQNAAVHLFADATTCSATNRGEIRLWVVESVDLNNTDVDALCFCRKKTVAAGEVGETLTYAWNCFNSSSLSPIP